MEGVTWDALISKDHRKPKDKGKPVGSQSAQEASPEGVPHGAQAEHDVQVVPHALDEVCEEAVRGFRYLLCPGLVYDLVLDLLRNHTVSEARPLTAGAARRQLGWQTGVGFKATLPVRPLGND